MNCWKNNPTLEHVIQKSPDAWWKQHLITKTMKHEDVISRLGNLTLLDIDENQELGNIKYPDKVKIYLAKALPLNLFTFDKMMTDFGLPEIRQREKIIADKIIEKNLWL